MDLEYRGELRIKHERIQPKKPNFCRLSLAANAINFFHGQSVFTPEQVLEILNEKRVKSGITKVDPDIDTLTDEEIENFVKEHGDGVRSITLEGARYMNFALWDGLIESGFIVAPDHQMLYSDPLNLQKNELNFLPLDLVRRLVSEGGFDYHTFLELYSLFIARAGYLDEGHLDMVFDVRKVNGINSVILANLASKGNEYPLAIPWHLLKNYLCFDWSGAQIDDVGQLPDEEGMKKLMTDGTLEYKSRDFFYGSLEIYYPKDKKEQLDAMIKSVCG